MDNQPYYGAPGDSNTKTLGERLRDYYDPQEFVTVQNIDTSPITYQFASPSDIETFSDYPGHKDTIQKAVPQVVTLKPGETKLCPAYEADLMIENLIKQITTNLTQKDIEEDKAVAWQSANWTDPATQERLIKQIFVGKKDVVGSYNKTLKTSEIEKDLESASSTAK